LPGAGKVVLKR